MDHIPRLSDDLINDLAQMYLPRCKGADENEAHHQRYAGKVELIQSLLMMLEDLTEE